MPSPFIERRALAQRLAKHFGIADPDGDCEFYLAGEQYLSDTCKEIDPPPLTVEELRRMWEAGKE